MSTLTPTTDPNVLLFPAFLYGPHGECRRKMKAEAKKWTKRYAKDGTFPEPTMIPVPPGSLMYCSAFEVGSMRFGASAQEPHWFFYLVDNMRMEVDTESPAAFKVFELRYEEFVCRYPWGALSVTLRRRNNSRTQVTQRLEAILSFWEQLDTLRYYQWRREYDLSNLMLYFNEGTLRMWVDVLRGSANDVLRTAIERMRNASEDEIRERILRRLHEVADAEPELKHRDWLKSPGVFEAGLADDIANLPECYENLKSGCLETYHGFLTELDRKYPNG